MIYLVRVCYFVDERARCMGATLVVLLALAGCNDLGASGNVEAGLAQCVLVRVQVPQTWVCQARVGLLYTCVADDEEKKIDR